MGDFWQRVSVLSEGDCNRCGEHKGLAIPLGDDGLHGWCAPCAVLELGDRIEAEHVDPEVIQDACDAGELSPPGTRRRSECRPAPASPPGEAEERMPAHLRWPLELVDDYLASHGCERAVAGTNAALSALTIECPECHGHGFHQDDSHPGNATHTCEHCKGHRVVAAPGDYPTPHGVTGVTESGAWFHASFGAKPDDEDIAAVKVLADAAAKHLADLRQAEED